MRKILFRAKRKSDGQWVIGDLCTASTHHECEIRQNGCIVHGVDPATVGQFTGLQDKEGRDVYEGDILLVEDEFETLDISSPAKGFVGYGDGTFVLRSLKRDRPAFRLWNDGDHDHYSIELLNRPEIAVLGNVHDHPELLKPLSPR